MSLEEKFKQKPHYEVEEALKVLNGKNIGLIEKKVTEELLKKYYEKTRIVNQDLKEARERVRKIFLKRPLKEIITRPWDYFKDREPLIEYLRLKKDPEVLKLIQELDKDEWGQIILEKLNTNPGERINIHDLVGESGNNKMEEEAREEVMKYILGEKKEHDKIITTIALSEWERIISKTDTSYYHWRDEPIDIKLYNHFQKIIAKPESWDEFKEKYGIMIVPIIGRTIRETSIEELEEAIITRAVERTNKQLEEIKKKLEKLVSEENLEKIIPYLKAGITMKEKPDFTIGLVKQEQKDNAYYDLVMENGIIYFKASYFQMLEQAITDYNNIIKGE